MLITAVIIWIIDGIYNYLAYQESNLLSYIFIPTLIELLNRFIITSIIIIAGEYAAWLNNQDETELQLRTKKERETNEIYKKVAWNTNIQIQNYLVTAQRTAILMEQNKMTKKDGVPIINDNLSSALNLISHLVENPDHRAYYNGVSQIKLDEMEPQVPEIEN